MKHPSKVEERGGSVKRLSPYRRLEAELEIAIAYRKNARIKVESLTVQNLLLRMALGDALGYVDRLMPQSKNSGEGWTAADVKRLAELRKLANG